MRARVVVVVVGALSAACLFPDLSGLTDAGDASDAAKDVAPDADASVVMCDPQKPFGTPRALSEINNSDNQFNPTLTGDELEILWGELVPVGDGGAAHVMHSTRTAIGQLFGAPSIESALDNGGPVDPTLSDDGLELVYAASGSIGNYDLFRASRTKLGTSFGNPIQLPSNVLSTGDEISPTLATSGDLYFVSNRSSGYDVYLAASLGNNVFQAPAIVPELSSGKDDGIALTHDELWVYVASRRTDLGTAGGVDVFLGHRATTADAFGPLTNVSEINTPNDERVKFVSRDACRIYYESNDDLWLAEKTP